MKTGLYICGMELTLLEKVQAQTKGIEESIIILKQAIFKIQVNKRDYYKREYEQKVESLQNIIDALNSLKINI